MARKRGLAANRGLDALLGSIKKEKAITAVALRDDSVIDSSNDDGDDDNIGSLDADSIALAPNAELSHDQPPTPLANPAGSTSESKKNQLASAASAPSEQGGKQADKSQAKLGVIQGRDVKAVASSPSANANAKGSAPSHGVKKIEQRTEQRQPSADDEMTLVQMDVQRLQAGKYQPRRDMSEPALSELASSIRQHGVMQPIVIRPLLAAENRETQVVTHEIIAGERRWRAAKMAGQTTIPAIERVLSDELAIALALIENIQREDLSVIEQAEALQRFHTEFNMSHAMIAEVVGKARTTVSNLLRLNHLNDIVKDYLSAGSLDMGHARCLLSLSSEQQPIIAEKIIAGSLTVRDAEKLVKSILNPDKKPVDKLAKLEAQIEAINKQLSDRLGAAVKVKQKKGGKGSVEIFFHSHEELEALLQHLQ